MTGQWAFVAGAAAGAVATLVALRLAPDKKHIRPPTPEQDPEPSHGEAHGKVWECVGGALQASS